MRLHPAGTANKTVPPGRVPGEGSVETQVKCQHIESVGQYAVFVDARCPHMHMIRGVMVASKSACRKCREEGRKNCDNTDRQTGGADV